MPHRTIRFALVVFTFIALCGTASAAESTFLKIPGVVGNSTSKGHEQWSNLESYSADIAPAVMADKKTLTPQCTGTAVGNLGAAAASVTGLVGTPVAGDVTIEVVSLGGFTQLVTKQIVLKGATITHYVSSTGHDSLEFHFTQIAVTTRDQNPDGSAGAVRTGTFDCMRP